MSLSSGVSRHAFTSYSICRWRIKLIHRKYVALNVLTLVYSLRSYTNPRLQTTHSWYIIWFSSSPFSWSCCICSRLYLYWSCNWFWVYPSFPFTISIITKQKLTKCKSHTISSYVWRLFLHCSCGLEIYILSKIEVIFCCFYFMILEPICCWSVFYIVYNSNSFCFFYLVIQKKRYE